MRLTSPSRAIALIIGANISYAATIPRQNNASSDPKILILGGGVSGIIAACTLTEQGFANFVIIEARDKLGGRLKSTSFGSSDKFEATVELGMNWVQGMVALFVASYGPTLGNCILQGPMLKEGLPAQFTNSQ